MGLRREYLSEDESELERLSLTERVLTFRGALVLATLAVALASLLVPALFRLFPLPRLAPEPGGAGLQFAPAPPAKARGESAFSFCNWRGPEASTSRSQGH